MQDAIYILFKHKLRILAVTLVFFLAAVAYGAAVGPLYTASGRLLVNAAGERGQAARTEAEILRDPALIRGMAPSLVTKLPTPIGLAAVFRALGTVWRHCLVDLGLVRRAPPDEVLAAHVGRALRVQAVPDTDVVVLHVTWRDPAFAAIVLNALLGEQGRLAAGSTEAAQTLALAQTRLHDAQAQLAQIEARIAALPQAVGGADQGAMEREKDRISSRIAAARSDADALRVQRDLAAKKLDAAEKAYQGGGWVDNPDTPSGVSGAPALDQTFVDLLSERGKLLAHLPADSPKIHAIDTQISEAREHAYQTVRQVLGDRLRGFDERLAALAAQIGTDEAAMRSLDDRLVQVEALGGSRQEAVARVTEAERHLEGLKRETETAARDAAGLHVLSPASVSADPDFPSPAFVASVAAFLGFLAGLASAVLAEHKNLTLDRPQDIARVLKIPVLARVPELR